MDEYATPSEPPGSFPLLRVWLCGSFRMEWIDPVTGQVLPPVDPTNGGRDRAAALSLLALLLCQPNRQAHRDWILEQFWPENSRSAAVHRLENIFSCLRKLLRPPSGGESLLHSSLGKKTGGPSYGLEAYPKLWVDTDALAWQVEQAARMERFGDDALPYWERAFALLKRGPFLADEAYEVYASWIKEQRDKLEGYARQCVHALSRLYLASYGERGKTEALLLLRTYWQQHKTDEDALRPLLELLGEQERYQEAEQYYQQLLAALAEEEPDEEGKPRLPDPRTRDIRDYLSIKQIQRGKYIAPALQPMQSNGTLLLRQFQQPQSAYPVLPSDSAYHTSPMSLFESHKLQTDELLDRFIRAMKKPSTINETTCRYIEARTDGYWKDHYDAIFAPSDLLSDALGQFQKVISLLENSLLPTVRMRLCASASRIAQFAGALYFDMGNYTYSKWYRQVAILAAREAKNQELEAVAWGRLSMTCMYGNQLQDALINIQEARRLASPSNSFRVHAWLAAVEAEIQAKQGNREACLEALDVAECVENIHPSDQDPHWLYFDRPSLIGFQGACYRRLYRPDDPQTCVFLENARKALLTTLSLPILTQRQPITLADLADTYLLQGEVAEACKLASQAVAIIAELQSRRNLQRLHTLRRDMEPWKDTRDVQELDRQLTVLDEQLAPLFS
jgi:DNA-binding SARP family transcriptional activator